MSSFNQLLSYFERKYLNIKFGKKKIFVLILFCVELYLINNMIPPPKKKKRITYFIISSLILKSLLFGVLHSKEGGIKEWKRGRPCLIIEHHTWICIRLWGVLLVNEPLQTNWETNKYSNEVGKMVALWMLPWQLMHVQSFRTAFVNWPSLCMFCECKLVIVLCRCNHVVM